MNNKFGAIITTALSLLLLNGCSYINSKLPKNPPSAKERTCAELRRNIIFNTTSMPNMTSSSPTKRAEMERLYQKNDCDNINKN